MVGEERQDRQTGREEIQRNLGDICCLLPRGASRTRLQVPQLMLGSCLLLRLFPPRQVLKSPCRSFCGRVAAEWCNWLGRQRQICSAFQNSDSWPHFRPRGARHGNLEPGSLINFPGDSDEPKEDPCPTVLGSLVQGFLPGVLPHKLYPLSLPALPPLPFTQAPVET